MEESTKLSKLNLIFLEKIYEYDILTHYFEKTKICMVFSPEELEKLYQAAKNTPILPFSESRRDPHRYSGFIEKILDTADKKPTQGLTLSYLSHNPKKISRKLSKPDSFCSLLNMRSAASYSYISFHNVVSLQTFYVHCILKRYQDSNIFNIQLEIKYSRFMAFYENFPPPEIYVKLSLDIQSPLTDDWAKKHCARSQKSFLKGPLRHS